MWVKEPTTGAKASMVAIKVTVARCSPEGWWTRDMHSKVGTGIGRSIRLNMGPSSRSRHVERNKATKYWQK